MTIHIEHRRVQTRSPHRCKKVSPRLALGEKCFRANRPLVFSSVGRRLGSGLAESFRVVPVGLLVGLRLGVGFEWF